MEYLVRWEIQLNADSVEQAAEIALQIQRDPSSLATVFFIFARDGIGYSCIDVGEKTAQEIGANHVN